MPGVSLLETITTMRPVIVLLVVSVLLGCVRRDVAPHRQRQQSPPNTGRLGTLTLPKARSILAARVEGSKLGTIPLDGYSFHRVIEIGGGITVLVVSCNLGGGIATFKADGANIVTRPTHEIVSTQIVDLDEDGVDELVTDEIDGRGTGVLERTFRIYRSTPSGVDQIWQGESYSRRAADEVHLTEKLGLLHFDHSGAGRPARMVHAIIENGRSATSTWEVLNGQLRRTTGSDSR